MASRELARLASGPADYAEVYDRVLAARKEPVILYWLGDMFDPRWPATEVTRTSIGPLTSALQ